MSFVFVVVSRAVFHFVANPSCNWLLVLLVKSGMTLCQLTRFGARVPLVVQKETFLKLHFVIFLAGLFLDHTNAISLSNAGISALGEIVDAVHGLVVSREERPGKRTLHLMNILAGDFSLHGSLHARGEVRIEIGIPSRYLSDSLKYLACAFLLCRPISLCFRVCLLISAGAASGTVVFLFFSLIGVDLLPDLTFTHEKLHKFSSFILKNLIIVVNKDRLQDELVKAAEATLARVKLPLLLIEDSRR
jgi:hypothetical protein